MRKTLIHIFKIEQKTSRCNQPGYKLFILNVLFSDKIQKKDKKYLNHFNKRYIEGFLVIKLRELGKK